MYIVAGKTAVFQAQFLVVARNAVSIFVLVEAFSSFVLVFAFEERGHVLFVWGYRAIGVVYFPCTCQVASCV